MENIETCLCDFTNPLHSSNFLHLINHYIQDDMGGGKPHTLETAKELVQGMASHPSSFVVFAKVGNAFAGMVVCFVNFSTFKARPFINIHDVVVDRAFRGQGVGRIMMETVLEMAEMKSCCKITLEVRADNTIAKELYKSLGFHECQPSSMHFWELLLEEL